MLRTWRMGRAVFALMFFSAVFLSIPAAASAGAPGASAAPASSLAVLASWTPVSSHGASTTTRAAARPRITRLSRASGRPGLWVTIEGRRFGKSRGKARVTFGAVKATQYRRWNATRIVCRIPAVRAGKVLIRVRTVSGASRGKPFTVRMPAGAVTLLDTADWSMESSYWYELYSPSDKLAYYTDSDGNLGIVSVDIAQRALRIDTFDPLTLQRIGRRKSVSFAGWPLWGNFYAGPDGYFYVVIGRENPDHNDALNVVAVRRYDRTWTLLSTAYLTSGATGHGVIYPFQYMPPAMVLVGNRLVVHMAYVGYDGHQGSSPIEVDVDALTATPFYQLGGTVGATHSKQQRVAMNGTSLVVVDHGDASPRSIQMGVMANYPDSRDVSTYDLMEFNGAPGNNFTGSTLTGMVSGPSGIVVIGSSIQQPDAPNGPLGSRSEHPNVFAIWADPATGAHTVHWLTDYAPQGDDQASYPRVVQVGADRYAVLFSVRNDSGGQRMEYRLIDSAGDVLARTSFPRVFFCGISDPIRVGDRVYWVGFEPSASGYDVPRHIFGIDVSDPAAPALLSSAAL